MTQSQAELLELLTRLKATLVAVHRVLRVAPGNSKSSERFLAGLFDGANALEEEVLRMVQGREVV